MLLSILQKSRALLGVGTQEENQSSSVDVLETEVVEDDESNKKRNEQLKETVFDHIRTIRDPEKPATLEDLHVVEEEYIKVGSIIGSEVYTIFIEFNPTVPHCSLATLIGLCIRVKLERSLNEKFKLDIYIKKGTHSTEDEINKQINDKERIAAAMENPNLREIVESCIEESE